MSDSNQRAIARFVGTVIAQHRHLVTVTGFASPKGSAGENSSLVIRRANVVANELRQLFHQRHAPGVTIHRVPGGIKYLPSPFKDHVATLVA